MVLYLGMRVIRSLLIFLVLVGCNSTTDEVTFDETTVDVIADTAQVTVEEFDTIKNEIDEKEVDTIETKLEEEEDAIDRSKLLELYARMIETARRQNDFSTIKKYVKSDICLLLLAY